MLLVLTQIEGQMNRCKPAFDGQSNSKRIEPFALHDHVPVHLNAMHHLL